jgi:sugar phosphate permease
MPDMNRTSASTSAATLENVASKPTKTRWLVLVLISFMYLITYMDRSNISVAQPEIAKQFGLSKTAMGLVLAAFTWAYALGQVPSGWFGDRFGPKRVLTVIMTLWSATAVMTGAAFGFGSCVGDCLQRLLPQRSRRPQRRQSDGIGPHSRRQPGWNH